jgi:hypothetical protein
MTSSNIGQKALEKAKSQIGQGEVGDNNKGPNVLKYTRGSEGEPWCASFISWCLEEGYTEILHLDSWAKVSSDLRKNAPFKRSAGAKKVTGFATLSVNKFPKVDVPAPGDLVCWHRGAANAYTGHVGIVSRVDLENGLFWSIEGNKGSFPAKIQEFKHVFGEASLLGFVRVPDNSFTMPPSAPAQPPAPVQPAVVAEAPSNKDEKPKTKEQELIDKLMNAFYEFLNGILPGRKDE